MIVQLEWNVKYEQRKYNEMMVRYVNVIEYVRDLRECEECIDVKDNEKMDEYRNRI